VYAQTDCAHERENSYTHQHWNFPSYKITTIQSLNLKVKNIPAKSRWPTFRYLKWWPLQKRTFQPVFTTQHWTKNTCTLYGLFFILARTFPCTMPTDPSYLTSTTAFSPQLISFSSSKKFVFRNPVNTDNHGPINRQPTCLFNASELRSNRSSSNLGTSLADIFRILLPLAQRIGYYHTRRLPAVSPVLIARCAANTNATTRTNSGGDWRTPSSKTYTPTGRFRCVDLVGFATERRGPHNIAVYAVVFYSKGKVFPYSLPSVEPGADPGVQAVSPQVTLSESHRRPGSRLPLLSARPAVTSVAFTKWRYL